MAQNISKEQLKHKIVTTMREEGLDGIFGEDVIDAIQEKVKHLYKQQLEKSAFEDFPIEENKIQETNTRPPVQGGPNQFPYEGNFETSDVHPDKQIETEPVGMTAGEVPSDVPYEPVRSVTAEAPKPLRDMEPGEIFVFNYNDAASVGGENLANKAFRTMDDPERKKSAHDYWMEEGKTSIKVYAAKFEEIGTINYDYKNSTAYFEDKKSEIETPNRVEKENPYAAPSTPEIETPSTETDLRKSIDSSVDLEASVIKVIKDLLKDKLNSEPESAAKTTPSAVYERQTKDEVLNTFKKVEVPEAIKTRLLGESHSDVEYLSQSSEYAAYLYEGKKYVVFNDDETKAYLQA